MQIKRKNKNKYKQKEKPILNYKHTGAECRRGDSLNTNQKPKQIQID